MYLHLVILDRPARDERRLELARHIAESHGGRLNAWTGSRVRVLGAVISIAVVVMAAMLAASARPAAAAQQAGNPVSHWNAIAENAVVGSGAFQNEGLVYMAYVSAAVYDAAAAIDGGYRPYVSTIVAGENASMDAAVAEAAYRTLIHLFPAQASSLGGLYDAALAAIPEGAGKTAGLRVGSAAAHAVIASRQGDGRSTTIGATSGFPHRTAGPGNWRLTGPTFAAPQTPWVGSVRPFVLESAEQFLPAPPPALDSSEWAEAVAETRIFGSTTSGVRDIEQTGIARFWSANVIRQYNRLARDLALELNLGAMETARLAAMVNVVGADAQIAVMHAKYRYLFWRPVTAIDPAAVISDGLGPTPGFDDGNGATTEQAGWRPLLTTPNHPEYPAAHASITSAMAQVVGEFLDTNGIELTVRGFDPAGTAGNLDATRHFSKPHELRQEIVDARVWAGVHYRFSGVAGLELGRNVAKYGLKHAFRPTR